MNGSEPRIEIRRGEASEEELAALIAVVREAYVDEATHAVAEEPRASAWQATRRGLRRPLRRGLPWGRFAP